MSADRSAEKELIDRLKAGDHGAFEILVRLHYRSVYHMAYRYMMDHGGADDVTQESLLKAFHAIGSFREESSFKSWLLRITSNTALNALRSRGRHQAVDIQDVDVKSIHAEFNRLEDLQTAKIIKVAVSKLPPKQRQALELRIFDDLSFKEIAEIMECPFDTAKANFRHALMNLKKILSTEGEGRDFEELKQAFESLNQQEDEGHEN
jgi:RNA polymerase sigma-70 factor (ECF subfamily)